MKKTLLVLILTVCFLFNFVGCNNTGSDYVISEKTTPSEVYAQTFDVIGGEDVMPICGFFGPYVCHTDVTNCNNLPDYFSDEVFDRIQEIGINTITMYNNPNDYVNEKYLEMCDKYNIGVFMNDAAFSGFVQNGKEYGAIFDYDYFTNKILEWNKHRCFVGIHTRDEPFTPMFDSLRQIFEAFDSLNLNGKVAYSNLISFDYTGSSVYSYYADYVTSEDYIEQYYDATHAKMLSSTLYPFLPETTDANLKGYFDYLSVANSYSQKFKIPVWRMMQAGGYYNDAGNWVSAGDPYPTEAEFIFDANISLAYGVKALQFFPMIQPEWFARSENVTYDYNRNGVIGANGELTNWGYYAKKITTQVRAIDHVLMHSAFKNIILNGEEPNRLVNTDERKTEIVNSFRQVKSVSGGDALVGCFDYYGGTALYVVNFSRINKNKITVNFDNNYGYEVTQRGQLANVSGKSITLTLEAGEGALVVIK